MSNSKKKRVVAKQILALVKEMVADKAKSHGQFFPDSDWQKVNEQYPIERTDELFGTILDYIRNYDRNMDDYCKYREELAQGLAVQAKEFVDNGHKLTQFDKLDDLIQAQGMIEEWCNAAQDSNAKGNGQYTKRKDIPTLDNDATFDSNSGLWIPAEGSRIVKSKENWRDYITKFMGRFGGRFAPKFALFMQRITASFPEEAIDSIRTEYKEYGKGTLLESEEIKAKIRYILSTQHGDVEVGKALARMENVNTLLKARGVVGKFSVTTRKFLGDLVNANGDLIAYASVDAPCVQKIEQLGNQADDLVDTLNEQIKNYKEEHPKSKKQELQHVTDEDANGKTTQDFGTWDDEIGASAKGNTEIKVAKNINAGFVDTLKNFWNSATEAYQKVVKNVQSYKTKLYNFLSKTLPTDMKECEEANNEAVMALREGSTVIRDFVQEINTLADSLGYKKA